MPTSSITKRLLISGTVQGVGYRAWMARTAPQYQLSGWVRNLRDGRVEAMLRGEAVEIDAMVQACYRGPGQALVARLLVEDCDASLPSGFYIAADA